MELSLLLQTRGQLTSRSEDLDRAIELWREAAGLAAAGSARRRDRISGLATVLLVRYQRTGAAPDLTEGLALLEELGLTLDAERALSPNEAGLIFNLGNALWIEYRRTGDLALLDRAVVAFARAAQATPDASDDKALCVNSQAVALAERAERADRPEDLDTAVALFWLPSPAAHPSRRHGSPTCPTWARRCEGQHCVTGTTLC